MARILPWIVMMAVMMDCCMCQQVNNMAANSTSCTSVRSAYRSRGFNDRDAPQQPISGVKLRYCGVRNGQQQQQATCCTESMEAKLMEASRQQYEMVLRETTANLLATFTTRAKKFDDFFRELLENSKRDFHDMFKRTYGILYEQNSEVFTDLFRDLEDYYSRGKLDLEEAMDHFFTALYQRMFTVLNAQFRFDDKYLACVNTHMKELKPFGDVPKKLSVQVKRSFVATRTFAQALITGRDVVNKIQSLEPSPECHRAVMRMTTCPTCQGFTDLKPCSNLCLNVLKGCLAYHADLGTEWDNYVDALMKVSDRLLGPFNIELVVDPIDIKISDAIMNFQENGYEISQKVFKGCGQPRLGKRSAAEINFESVKFDRGTGPGTGGGAGGSGARPPAAAGTSLDRLVREIKQKVKQSRGFWSKIPQTVCTHEKMSSQSTIDGDCWNGHERTRYATALMGDGSAGSTGADLVPADAGRPNSMVNEQIFSLRLMTNKLENAYNGMDVDWEDGWVNGGSGSGSGSGDDDNDDDDSEDSMEDDDEDHVRPKPNKPTTRPVPANQRPKNRRPEPAQPAPPSREGDEDEDDIEFTAGNVPAARPDDRSGSTTSTTSSASPGADKGAPAARTKAVTSYLVPIVVMWLGNMF